MKSKIENVEVRLMTVCQSREYIEIEQGQSIIILGFFFQQIKHYQMKVYIPKLLPQNFA